VYETYFCPQSEANTGDANPRSSHRLYGPVKKHWELNITPMNARFGGVVFKIVNNNP